MLAFVVSLALASAARAAGWPCTDDAQTYCRAVPRGGGKIVACLKSHAPQLSDVCRIELKMRPIGSVAEPRRSAASGVIVWPTPWTMKNGEFAKALAVPAVGGMGVHFTWAEIQPGPDRYDFSALDQQLALARSRRLPVELAVPAGVGTPAWLFLAPPAGPGLPRLDFEIDYHGTDPCQKVSMPPPWLDGYQRLFGGMLAQVAAHLRATGYYDDVAAIKLTGMNTLTEELALPNQQPSDVNPPNACLTNAPAIWAAAGYRPSRVLRAMEGIAKSFQASFPDKLAAVPVITLFAFPPIGDNGKVMPRQQAIGLNAKLLNDLVGVAAKALRGHLAVQDCFLIGDMPADSTTMDLARANGVGVAWQTNIWFGRYGKGAACGGEGTTWIQKFLHPIACTAQTYLEMLHRGMYPQGGRGASKFGLFIEAFAPDVLSFPGAIKSAGEQWGRPPKRR